MASWVADEKGLLHPAKERVGLKNLSGKPMKVKQIADVVMENCLKDYPADLPIMFNPMGIVSNIVDLIIQLLIGGYLLFSKGVKEAFK